MLNTESSNELKMYTIYALPNHKDGVIRATKKNPETTRKNVMGKQQNKNPDRSCLQQRCRLDGGQIC